MGSLILWIIVLCSPVLSFAVPILGDNIKVLQSASGEIDWWQSSSLYQVYPRSFKDSNGDGIGDIKGITQRLGYLKEIGVTAIWLAPVFKSPMVDFGYDISDFYDIQQEYGTLEDLDELISETHKIGLKIILDFVPNHTSDECEWFQKALKGDPEYVDYYLWHPGYPDPNNATNRLPPSNWLSVFWKSGWTWRDERQAFYYHQFAAQQPDLNFRNPKVVQQMTDIILFWLKRGADGFRIDATPHIFEAEPDSDGRYPDEPPSGLDKDPNDYDSLAHIYTRDLPETLDLMFKWRKFTDDYQKEFGGDTRILLTEAVSPVDVVMQYYGNGTHKGSHVPFNFLLIDNLKKDSNAHAYVNQINTWMNLMPSDGTANWVLGNHDYSRVGSKIGEEKIDLLNMFLMMLPGAVVTYYGEEIGMTDIYVSWEDTVDPQACGSNPDIYMYLSRDPNRTPFQWDDSTSAGFSTSTKTWLPISEKYRQVNVKRERRFVKSALNTYMEAKKLRDTNTFKFGATHAIVVKDSVFTVIRELMGEPTYVYVGNVGAKLERVDLSTVISVPNVLRVAVSSSGSSRRISESVNINELILLPGEALILHTTGGSNSAFSYYFNVLG